MVLAAAFRAPAAFWHIWVWVLSAAQRGSCLTGVVNKLEQEGPFCLDFFKSNIFSNKSLRFFVLAVILFSVSDRICVSLPAPAFFFCVCGAHLLNEHVGLLLVVGSPGGKTPWGLFSCQTPVVLLLYSSSLSRFSFSHFLPRSTVGSVLFIYGFIRHASSAVSLFLHSVLTKSKTLNYWKCVSSIERLNKSAHPWQQEAPTGLIRRVDAPASSWKPLFILDNHLVISEFWILTLLRGDLINECLYRRKYQKVWAHFEKKMFYW